MKFIADIIKGILIGVANVIPGVSGGTMMVSMGVYEKIIGAVNNLWKDFRKSVLQLLPLGIGLVLGIVLFSFIIPFCLEEYPFPTCFCFMGLILGGVPSIVKPARESLKKENKKLSLGHVLTFAVLFGLAVGMAAMNETETNSANFELSLGFILIMFVVGVISAATMVIPGVSGSLVLMILGFYSGIMSSISGFISSVFDWNWSAILHYAGILIPFGIGVISGIFAVAKLMEWLFAKYSAITYSGILGLIVASPIAIIMKMGNNNTNPFTVTLGILLFVAGAWFTYWFGKKTEGME